MAAGSTSVRFPRPAKDSFRNELTKRVKNYFEENNISTKANFAMVLKTIGMMALYLIPYFLILLMPLPLWLMLLLFVVMGIGMAGIGMGVMHDAIHGAYHSNRKVNQFIGASIYLISGNAANWRVQHNILHHTFTNIDGLDEDMESSGILRLHPSQKWKKYHRFQKYYYPFIYGLLTINWVMLKDYKQLNGYYKRGIGGHTDKSIKREWLVLILTKSLYFSLFLVLPIIFASQAWYFVLLGFVMMHFTAGVVLSYVFQLAHMVEGLETMDVPEDGMAEDEWMEHQLKTTADFAKDSKLINWFVGGLNFQVEHHLFPTICHIHYPALARIVKKTAEEFNVPYTEHLKLKDAIGAHVRHVKLMALRPSA